MRWQNLTIEAEQGAEQSALPGYRDEATVRRFNAPEALNTRFYEIRAKSVLNRVPEKSAVPFRWTVNPYRGCSHGCLLLLCSADAHLPRLRRGPRLRQRDRRQGQRARGAGRGAAAPVVDG
ncbi:hypothetical protein [Conexibacter sp. SYSU D00693]|uniref:hypothetical protein n=1 Tax=Conexibacter sp. SYSU D00693 TaxID=2812560 RepID=UPI00196AB7E7|nr:hypothetical protein [Conexibacter sp. SYSU D00693]